MVKTTKIFAVVAAIMLGMTALGVLSANARSDESSLTTASVEKYMSDGSRVAFLFEYTGAQGLSLMLMGMNWKVSYQQLWGVINIVSGLEKTTVSLTVNGTASEYDHIRAFVLMTADGFPLMTQSSKSDQHLVEEIELAGVPPYAVPSEISCIPQPYTEGNVGITYYQPDSASGDPLVVSVSPNIINPNVNDNWEINSIIPSTSSPYTEPIGDFHIDSISPSGELLGSCTPMWSQPFSWTPGVPY